MACRMLAYTLPRTDQDAWWVLRSVLQDRLTTRELVSLAFMALKALDHDDARLTAETALVAGAGQPIPPLIGYMDEAAFWADFAAPEELEAYCLTTFKAMPRARQAAFLDYVQGRQAA